MRLKTFQRLTRVAQWETEGELRAEWRYVPSGMHVGYQAMVEAMARAGVDTQGRPPMWAWSGELTLLDATMLLDPEHDLSQGYATVEFSAPAELAVTSDYGPWNDFLAETLTGGTAAWEISSEPPAEEPRQVCLPYLRSEWIHEVRPLPTSGWDAIDLSAPA